MFLKKTIVLLFLFCSSVSIAEISIGAKKFTEGNILAHILKIKLQHFSKKNIDVKENLGGTGILNSAIERGEIDLYVDYTGTLYQVFSADEISLESKLFERNIVLGGELGFNNSYGLAVKKESKQRNISDFKNTQFTLGISHEFFKRKDGFQPLISHYQLEKVKSRPMEHTLLYSAMMNDYLDVIEVYTTDAKIKKYHLRVLEDDANFFPTYKAVLLGSIGFKNKYTSLWEKLNEYFFRNPISSEKMIELNYLVEEKKLSYQQAAKTYFGMEVQSHDPTHELLIAVKEHVAYVLLTVFLCTLIGIPLGIISAKNKLLHNIFVPLISALQTIPSLALLVFLIPFFGLGGATVYIALIIYGLLPIVKNTITALQELPKELTEYSELINMSIYQKTMWIELPMCKNYILGGVKLSAVYTVGIAVIAAFVGAGGLGSLIVTGLSLDDHQMILRGAIPSALLAILIEGVFYFFTRKDD